MSRKPIPLLAFAATIGLAHSASIRFIEVTSAPGLGGTGGTGAFFHIGEVEAFVTSTPNPGLDNANDLALAAAGASGSTTSGTAQHGADIALVDGLLNTGAATWSRNVTSTVEASALIDLGGTFDVGSVRVWQRTDGCCQDRLRNFTVNLYEDDGAGSVGSLFQSFDYPGQVPTDGSATFTPVPEPATAMFGLLGGLLVLRRHRPLWR